MRAFLIALIILAASSFPSLAQICDNATIVLQDRYPDTYDGQVFTGVANNTLIKGDGAILLQQTKPDNLLAYPFRIENSGNNRACARDFAVLNTNPIDQSWSDSKNVNNAGISFNGGRLVLEDARFYGTHDAIRPSKGRPGETGKGAFEIRRVWVTWNRDDCIENDHKRSGIVEDSLFDGCYTLISSRLKENRDGRAERITIKNNLIRLARMPARYKHPDQSGYGGIYKYESNSPKINWIGNIILLEGYPGNVLSGVGSSKGHVGEECRDNILIWLGGGEYPGKHNWPEGCITIINDRSVYDEARAEWIAEHPEVPRLPDDPFTVSVKNVNDPNPQITQLFLDEPEPEPLPDPDPDPEHYHPALLQAIEALGDRIDVLDAEIDAEREARRAGGAALSQ